MKLQEAMKRATPGLWKLERDREWTVDLQTPDGDALTIWVRGDVSGHSTQIEQERAAAIASLFAHWWRHGPKLLAALSKYGSHRQPCGANSAEGCTCGLHEALAAPTEVAGI
jgi:hypothetical protein